MPGGVIHALRIVDKVSRPPKLYQEVSLSDWTHQQYLAKHLSFSVQQFPETLLGLCAQLIELRLGKMSIPDFSALMQAVQKSNTLKVFTVETLAAPKKQDIGALYQMLSGNQGLIGCTIVFGVQGATKRGEVSFFNTLKSSKIAVCSIVSGPCRIAEKNQRGIVAHKMHIPMHLPQTRIEQVSKLWVWLKPYLDWVADKIVNG